MDNPRGLNEKDFLIRDNINAVNNAADYLMEIKDAPIIKTKKRGRPKKERLHEVFPNEPQRNFKFKSVPIAPYKYQGHQKKIVQSSYETPGPSNQQQSREIFESKQNNNVNKRVEGNDKLCEFLPKEAVQKDRVLKIEIEPVVPPDGHPRKLGKLHKVCEKPGPTNQQQSRRIPRNIFKYKQINDMKESLDNKDKLCIKEPSSTTLSKDANETPVTITIININDILNNKIILDDGSDYKYNDESDDEFDDEYDNDSF
ncbi:uncharacterized protein LOC119689207 isoform X2 [Teleopsis dalmanni]|nr:uncharacterized protein LOC119689207 isoform X2 [Teleopsis dalmanni]